MKSRATRQKTLLEQELKKKKTFFSAEQFYNSIKKQDKRIGIATVYRFLAEQVKKNLLHSYTCNRKALFSLEKKTHIHFSCEKCHLEKHLDVETLDFLKKIIPGEICHFQIDVTGICVKCKS